MPPTHLVYHVPQGQKIFAEVLIRVDYIGGRSIYLREDLGSVVDDKDMSERAKK
jgi:hypothetical protein